jgi:hypothetical protein
MSYGDEAIVALKRHLVAEIRGTKTPFRAD